MEIPREVLSSEALEGIIESFILREGTDYGREEVGFDKKMQQIRTQIEKGDVRVVFDPESESVTLMTEQQWRRLVNPG